MIKYSNMSLREKIKSGKLSKEEAYKKYENSVKKLGHSSKEFEKWINRQT